MGDQHLILIEYGLLREETQPGYSAAVHTIARRAFHFTHQAKLVYGILRANANIPWHRVLTGTEYSAH